MIQQCNMNTRDIFLTRNRCNVDVAVDIPLAKGTLRKLNVRNIDESRGSHRIDGEETLFQLTTRVG